jgi:DNA primase
MLTRTDTALIKRAHAVADVIARYGVDLRPSGHTLVGRCPFHPDGGRPNLHVYPATQSWYCFRCALGGDVIRFVERIEGLSFRGAVARLQDERPTPIRPQIPSCAHAQVPPNRRVARSSACGPDERACLAAAVTLYHQRLLAESTALAYLESRGLDRATIVRHQLGYVAGDTLSDYLGWRRLAVSTAVRVGLLTRGGRERLANRVVVPELRDGQPIWLIGRTIPPAVAAPKYLGLPGRKPLLGWGALAARQEVVLVEGIFDWLVLSQWGIPSLALVGTHLRPDLLAALARFQHLYIVMDNDAAGHTATEALVRALGPRALPVDLAGVKDVADLALEPGGRARFARALSDTAPRRAA